MEHPALKEIEYYQRLEQFTLTLNVQLPTMLEVARSYKDRAFESLLQDMERLQCRPAK